MNEPSLSAEDASKPKRSWLIGLSTIITLCNLVVVIPFGVWYIQGIVNKNEQIETNKLELQKYAKQLQTELRAGNPDLNETIKSHGLDLERLTITVKQLENKKPPLELNSEVEQSAVLWHLKDLLTQLHGSPLTVSTKKESLAYLRQLRDTAAYLELEPEGQEITAMLDQDLTSLDSAKTINRAAIESLIGRLTESSARMELSAAKSAVGLGFKVDNPGLNTDRSLLANFWQELKSLIKVRQLDGSIATLDTKYFSRETLRLKLLELVYLVRANDISQLAIRIEEVKVYVSSHFDPNGPETQAALALIENLKGMTDVTVPNFSSTLNSIKDYFLKMNSD